MHTVESGAKQPVVLFKISSASGLFKSWGLCTHGVIQNEYYLARISILLGLGTLSIVPLLCAISPLSRQGAKTRTRGMANSDAIAKFRNNYARTR